MRFLITLLGFLATFIACAGESYMAVLPNQVTAILGDLDSATTVSVLIAVIAIAVAHSVTGLKVYSGVVKRMGKGRPRREFGLTGRGFIEMGDQVVKGVISTKSLDANLAIGANTILYVGKLLHTRFLYAVAREDGRLVKTGLAPLVLVAIAKLWLILLVTQLLTGRWLPVGADVPAVYLQVWSAMVSFYGYRSLRAFTNYASIKPPLPDAWHSQDSLQQLQKIPGE